MGGVGGRGRGRSREFGPIRDRRGKSTFVLMRSAQGEALYAVGVRFVWGSALLLCPHAGANTARTGITRNLERRAMPTQLSYANVQINCDLY